MTTLRRLTGLAGLLACAISFATPQSSHSNPSWKNAVAQAAANAPAANILVLDIPSGHLLASANLSNAGLTLATPGSTLKPLLLYYALSTNHWDPQRRVACTRKLHIAGHSLDCFHPLAPPMDAQQALAWSCNSYFASLAGTLEPQDLRQAFESRGLFASTGLATVESVAAFREPQNREQTQLAALGVEGIQVTLPELAQAYRSLALELASYPATSASRTVKAGLTDSASFGIAGPASLGGVPVAGKTGTATESEAHPIRRPKHGRSRGPALGQSHGWFLGLAPAQSPRVIVAVYLPAGQGKQAAHLAATILAQSPLREP